MVAAVQPVQGVAQALGVDLPAPLADLGIRIALEGGDHVAAGGLAQRVVSGGAVAGIVAKRNKVHSVGQGFAVLIADLQLHALFLKHALGVVGIGTQGLHVREQVHLVVQLHHLDDVIGVRGERVDGNGQDHAAHLVLRVDAVGQLHSLGAGHQLVVDGLIQLLVAQLGLGGQDGTADKGLVQNGVDLVERDPVLHLALVPLKQDLAVFQVQVDHDAVAPAVVLAGQGQGRFVVGNGDERLDAVLVALVNDIIVELQARLVGLCFLAGGENAAPRNGKAVDLEPHARKELDVLFVAVVVINAFQLEVVGGRLLGDDLEALGQHILDGQALAIFQIGTLALICGRCAAPEEISREIHTGSSLMLQRPGISSFSRHGTGRTRR